MQRNDFAKWHTAFLVPYLLTYVAGFLRSNNMLAYRLHPLLGISTLLIPLVVYLMSNNKKLIRQMVRNNFNLRGKPMMKVAKISTMAIVTYFVFSAVTGFVLNNNLYGTAEAYMILSSVHNIALYLVPVIVAAHVASRLSLKRSRARH